MSVRRVKSPSTNNGEIKMNEYTITNNIMHGKSFAFPIGNADFTTWRLNDDTGEYWMKFHFPSGKEIRLKVTEEELNDIVHKWTDVNINYNGDKNELEC